MTSPQKSIDFSYLDMEAFLTRRLKEHGAKVFTGATTVADRVERFRAAIVEAELDCAIIGRRPDRKAETYGQFFERHFGEPLHSKPKGK